MAISEALLSGDVQGTLLMPEAANDLGVIVLAGSSGRVDVTRARLFAAQNAVTLALRWFGGEGQVPGIEDCICRHIEGRRSAFADRS
jgi:hypothetical protein